MTNISFYQRGRKRSVILHLLMVIGVSLTGLSACSINRPVSQGIEGKVLWFEGDLMPGINKEPVEGQPLQREVYIYEPTRPQQAEIVDAYFYKNLKTKLIAKVVSGADGRFFIALEPGTYSVLVKENQGLFANTFDHNGIINPVTVGPRELVQILIRVDYKAAY